mgnify:CR=1 FL=1
MQFVSIGSFGANAWHVAEIDRRETAKLQWKRDFERFALSPRLRLESLTYWVTRFRRFAPR